MGNLIKAELFKLRKDRSFWTLTLILMGIAILYPLLIVFDGDGAHTKVNEFYMYNIIGTNNYVTRLVPCILAGFFISSEFSMGTMKSIVASGNNRIRIYFAKLIVFTIGAVSVSLILPLFMTAASAFYFDFNSMPEITYFFRTVGLIALYAAALAAIMALFAKIFTDSGKTIGFLLIFFILIDSILFALSAKFSWFEPVFNYSVFKLLADFSQLSLSSSELLKLVIVPFVTFIVFGLIGGLVFQKKEIK